MRKSQITAEFSSNIKTVWSVVTNNNDFYWRSDLEKIEVLEDGNTFVEYAKGGFQTEFVIKKRIEFEYYEFKMKNKNFTGYWT